MDYETDDYGEYLTQQVMKANLDIRVSELEHKISLLEKENEELKELLNEVHISSHGRFPAFNLAEERIAIQTASLVASMHAEEDDLK